MAGTTPNVNLPYPTVTDKVALTPAKVQELATVLDTFLKRTTSVAITGGVGVTISNATASTRAGWVHVQATINVNGGAASITNGQVLATIPAGYRLPAALVTSEYVNGVDTASGTPKSCEFRSDGTIRAVQTHAAGSGFIVCHSYPSS